MLYALAYMNVFQQPDSRVQASEWLVKNVPQGSKILVEPSQNTPPMGAYFTATNFREDYVLWGGTTRQQAERERQDYYHLFTLDTYKYLYADRVDDDEKRGYIASRLAAVDWIVIDDTYVQWYQHLPESQNAVLKQHYRDLLRRQARICTGQVLQGLPAPVRSHDQRRQRGVHLPALRSSPRLHLPALPRLPLIP